MVRSIGLEPTTPTMSRWCSNQLSYERNVVVTTGTHISGREDVARGKRHFSCTLHTIAELYSFRIYFTEPQGYFFASEHHGSYFQPVQTCAEGLPMC